jgi:uncharacterized protein
MDYVYQITAILLLLLATGVGWILNVVAMPGNWLIVLAGAAYAWLGPQTGVTQMSWKMVAALLILAILGEIVEFLAGVVGARRAGGSRRAAAYSLIGSLIGAVGGATAGIPIPVVGSAIGAVIGGAVGAFGGAAIAEHSRGEHMQQSMKVGQAAFWGRLIGTGAKTVIASILAIVVIISICA